MALTRSLARLRVMQHAFVSLIVVSIAVISIAAAGDEPADSHAPPDQAVSSDKAGSCADGPAAKSECLKELTRSETRLAARKISDSILASQRDQKPYDPNLPVWIARFWNHGATEDQQCAPEDRVRRFCREFVLALYRDVFLVGRSEERQLSPEDQKADVKVRAQLLEGFLAFFPKVHVRLPFDKDKEWLNRQRQVFILAAQLTEMEDVEQILPGFRKRMFEALEATKDCIIAREGCGPNDKRIEQINSAQERIPS